MKVGGWGGQHTAGCKVLLGGLRWGENGVNGMGDMRAGDICRWEVREQGDLGRFGVVKGGWWWECTKIDGKMGQGGVSSNIQGWG